MLLSSASVASVSSWGMELVESLVRFFTGTLFECFEGQLQLISRNEFLRVLELEDVKRSLKFSSTFLAAGHLRPWMMVSSRFVPYGVKLGGTGSVLLKTVVFRDGEVKNWWNDLERFLGPAALSLWQDIADSEIVPTLDTSLDRRQVETQRQHQEEEVS